MSRYYSIQAFLGIVIIVLSLFSAGCGTSANGDYYGLTVAPADNTLRYISGSEPESFDPIVGTGQPEARVYMAIFDGLVEYHPKTSEPIPGIAESWEISKDGTQYLFHLRKNAKFSNGEPITAKDFLYTFRRSLSPELASRNGYLGYYIKYAEPYNSGDFFVKGTDGKFLLEKDFNENTEAPKVEKIETVGTETDFSRDINSPMRLVVSRDNLKLAQGIEKNAKLKEAFKFNLSDLKNAPALVGKINKGTDEFNSYLKASISTDVLSACNETACDDAVKQKIVDGLNKVAEADSIFVKEWFANLALKNSAKFAKQIADENKKRDENNAKLDEDAAKLTDAGEKEAKLKGKKQPIGKLFYANKVVIEESFADELQKSPLVEIKGEDLGVEAVDDYTFRIKLYQPAPYFLGVLAHQFFRVVNQANIEKFGKNWAKAENIVTSGAFKIVEHHPYDEMIFAKDTNNWDAANVKLDRIEMYPMEEATTMMNLYKAGKVDALYNHTPPAAWLDEIKPKYKDEYMDFSEVAVEQYAFNVTKPPMNNVKVRQAFSLAIDRYALAKFRKVTKPLADYTPEGVFPQYEEIRKKVYDVKLKELNISPEEWEKRKFDPEKARKLLAEAGYPVQKSGNGWSCPTFPVDKITILYNTAESNKAFAEFMQSQWTQNLGLTVPLKNLEFKTFLPQISKLDYSGVARKAWVGDYMDPFTFLGLLYTAGNDSSTGWHDDKYDNLLDKANSELDTQKRYELLAEAEWFVSQQQPLLTLQTAATNWIKKPFVRGLYPNPATLHAWKFVYIERDKSKWDKDVANILNDKDPQVEDQINKLTAVQKQLEEQNKQADLAKNAKAE